MPPRVDFYVLPGDDERARLVYACRLVEKAYLQDHSVYVHLGSSGEAEAFDELLWTFSDRSFVPHELAQDGAPACAPVLVGAGSPAPARLLVNLSAAPPEFHGAYERIAEFVDAEPGRREAGRRRFVYYREQGCRLETHEV